MNKKRLVIFLIILCTLTSFVFASSAIGEKYLSAANEQYSIGNLEKAYNYINSSMKMYVDEPVPDAVLFSAHLIYLEYLQEIKVNEDMKSFNLVKNSLKDFPLVVDDDITSLIDSINQQEVEIAKIETSSGNKDFYSAQLEAMKSQQKAELQALKESQKSAAESQQKMLDQISAQTGSFTEAITNSTKASEQNSKTIKTAITVVVIALGVILLLVVLFMVISWQSSKHQQERFQATLEMVSQMNRSPSERLALGAVTDLYDKDLKSAGSSRWGVDALPEPELSDKEIAEINELAVTCERLGAEIDFSTGRKNNSKNVSELVYKLACAQGMNPGKAKIYFCAAMVYDAGFLAIDQDLLQANELNEKQKYEIRSHVQKGVEKLDFVPQRYKQIFIDAATKHHENLDGSGYPEGIKGDEIPMIARLIHIAEMFTSLISRRNYRGILDKESAVTELRSEGKAVDQTIVDLLDSII
ncbi:MAG: hypothetical protein BKP49_07965 [Treponema sp. CETP13]|nr:MAG: hypothetical protein BKP49_07965 [Treponema sp. CETP13]